MIEHKIPFLVVEPAKGEYKRYYGKLPGIHVYCTNPRYYSMLHINPFRFNQGIHVLEHLDRLIEIFNACWPLYAAMPAILKESFERAYIKCGWDLENSIYIPNGHSKFPTFNDVLEALPEIINSSSYNDEMTTAVYEVLEEQGIFEDISDDGITWTDCPLVTVDIRTFDSNDELPYDAPIAIALCESEDDYIRLDTDAPIYALVMGTETRFIKRQGTKLYFNVDPDDIGKLLLGIIEEEALCPFLSQLSYNFPAYEKEFLTESEKEDLELVCQASPMCTVTLPQVCDVGRTVELDVHIFPVDSDVALRVVTDSSDIVDVDGCILYPRAAGTAEIAVYIGDDPYPVATEVIKVRQRNLITDISLFPSALYMPVGGTSELTLTIVPESAENKDEIRWSCDDHSVANVDFSSGVITAIDCGRCCITAYTQEVSKTISLEVQPEIEDIICPCSFLELGVGEQKEWKYQLIPENAYGKDFLRAVSSDRNVAEYRGGYVLGKGLGECKIYIKNQSGSVSRELKVSVKKSKKFW